MSGFTRREQFDYLFNRFNDSDAVRMVYADGDFSLTLERASNNVTHLHHHSGGGTIAPPAPAKPIQSAEPPAGHVVRAPLVGTFYSASSPGAEAYVTVGKTVKPGDVLCIVEAMKTMNEIECDCEGVVKKIFADNGDLVEYGAPLFEIEV